MGEEITATIGCRLSLLSSPLSCTHVPVGYQLFPAPANPHNTAYTSDVAITLTHRERHSCRWWVPTRGKAGWERQIGASTSKVQPGTDVLIETLFTRFSGEGRSKISAARLCRSTRRGCPTRYWCRAVWTPLGRVCSTSRALLDVEPAPFHGAASRLSAANSNTRVPPPIRPHPSRQNYFAGKALPPPSYRESICEYLIA
jgi:hypothetical protein